MRAVLQQLPFKSFLLKDPAVFGLSIPVFTDLDDD
jgi:hypothetical protein